MLGGVEYYTLEPYTERTSRLVWLYNSDLHPEMFSNANPSDQFRSYCFWLGIDGEA